ncbi:mechanosensitive ion channel domain-containing protein [uncultured Eudoraea sp.]|uniref:mechanosensitive ion channel family protein n=1 Tax=uncultured Eudoraea sp. TaxID=1035614 RepID=UPI00260DD8FB|nr:mechanosensitive ion channel domain-containing protein [uncultured Eudoraea sp.]
MLAQEEDEVKRFFQEDVWASIKEFLNWGLHLGEEGENSIHITIGLLILLIITFIVTDFVLKTIRRLYTNKMEGDDKLKFISIFKFIKYFVYLLVILLTLRAGGVDITLLITASAALFVGLGLALQDLFQDIIGGIFIITDKSVQVGDIVETEGKVGKVVEIKLRTTRAITRDDRVIIIPNHKFMKDIVYNYTQNNVTTREEIRVQVAYGSNVDLVTEILISCLKSNNKVLKDPLPFVLFDDFGESGLSFSLHFYINETFLALKVKSEIRYVIDSEFRKNNIVIPFPQRDVHLFKK